MNAIQTGYTVMSLLLVPLKKWPRNSELSKMSLEIHLEYIFVVESMEN